jgi:uncharacterized protein (DUF2336 family)
VSTLVSFIGEIENAIASNDATRRVSALRRVTDLFVGSASQLGESQVTLFDEVILRLARDLEFRARVELADRLADIGNAPQQVVRDLAFDDNITVARPVLERSSRLTEDDLVEVAQQKGQDHLLALTQRPVLTERVTDVIVDRGNETVVRAVSCNSGAQFSEQGFAQLVEKAKADEELQGILETRRDLPAPHLRVLVSIARERASEVLQAELGERAQPMVEAAIAEAARRLGQSGNGGTLVSNYEAAVRRVSEEARDGSLDERQVTGWIREGRIEDALAGIAHLAKVPVDLVGRAYHAPSYDPLLFIVRSVQFGWGTFKLLLAQKAGRAPSTEILKAAFESFQRLSVSSAQRIVRFTLAHEHVTARLEFPSDRSGPERLRA